MKSSLFLLLALSAGALVSARVFHDDGEQGSTRRRIGPPDAKHHCVAMLRRCISKLLPQIFQGG
jgi:hypothetical protein